MILVRPGHFVLVDANGWHCTCSPDAHGTGGARGAEIHLRSAGVPQRKRNWRMRPQTRTSCQRDPSLTKIPTSYAKSNHNRRIRMATMSPQLAMETLVRRIVDHARDELGRLVAEAKKP